MNIKLKRTLDILTSIAAAGTIIYTGAWSFYAHTLREQIIDAWKNAPSNGVTLSTPMPVVRGFPGKFQINWTGTIKTAQIEASIPNLRLSFWPIPQTTMTLDFPNGLTINVPEYKMPADQQIIFNNLYVAVEIPKVLPNEWTREEIQKIHDAGTVFRLGTLRGAGPVMTDFTPEFTAHGEMSYDENLQTKAQIDFNFTSPEKIRDLLAETIQSPMGKSFATGAINSLITKDEKTGQDILPLSIKIENERVYAGPLQVGYIGHTYWPSANGATSTQVSAPSRTPPPIH